MDFAKNNQRLTRVDMSSKDNNNNKNNDDDKHCELRSEFMILKSVTSCSKRVNYLHRDKKNTSALKPRSLIMQVIVPIQSCDN